MTFCTPNIFFILFSTISIGLHYYYIKTVTYGLALHVFSVAIWSLLLYFFCRINWFHFAWFLVLLPFIIEYYALSILLKKAIKDPNILSQFETLPTHL